MEGLLGEESIAELCRREGIDTNIYYRWLKEFPEAGEKRLAGDISREATSDEVRNLRTEARALKKTLAELLMENRLLKKSMIKERTVYEYSASQKFEIIRLSITYRHKRTQLQKNYGYVNEDTKKSRKAM